MKRVMGGNPPAGGTCQALVAPGQAGNPPVVITGLSSSAASGAYGMIHWCCSQCGTATWAIQP